MQYSKAKVTSSHLDQSTKGRKISAIVYLLPFCCLVFSTGILGCSHSTPLGISGLNLSNPGVTPTKISDLQHHQDAATTVYLEGQVYRRAPFLGSGAYQLQDASGTIWVITNQTLPNVGDRILLKGQVQFQGIPLGGQELGEVYVQQQQQLQRQAGQLVKE
jgi:hypothetical protein